MEISDLLDRGPLLVGIVFNAASNDLLGKAVCYCSKLQLEGWTDEVRPELDCTTDQLKLH